jgi:hypothetical protein
LELQKVNHKLDNKKGGFTQAVKSFFYGLNGQVDLSVEGIGNTQTTQNTLEWILGYHSFNRKALSNLVETGYCMNPVVFGVINKILLSTQNLKFVPYRYGKPYKSGTFDADIQKVLFNLCTTGTVIFWKREVVGFGQQLFVCDTVNMTETFDGRNYKYQYRERNNFIKIDSDELIICKIFDNPSRFTQYGLSPLQAAIMPLDALREMYTADTSLLKNKGSELLISNGSEMPLLENEQGGFDIAMNKRIAGAKRAGSVATTTAKVEVHQLGRTIKELALWDGYKIKTRDICNVLQFPSSLANDPDSKTYANYSESLKSLYNECVIPFASLVLNNKELKSFLGYEIFIDTSSVDCLQASQQIRAEKAKTNQEAIITLNTNVNSGNITRDIAVTILVSEWGFDEIEADMVIIDKSSQNISTSDQVNVLSPIVATKVLESMTTDERRDLVGLGHIEGGETIPQPKPSF